MNNQSLCTLTIVVLMLFFLLSDYRNKLKFFEKLRKHHNTNPRRGPFHFRAPSRILFHTVRGMLPHKTFRVKQALARLKVFEGVPPPYDTMKRLVVPDALRATRLKAQRRYAVLGRLASETGWKHWDLIKSLEAKRKVKAEAFYQKKKAQAKAYAAAAAQVDA